MTRKRRLPTRSGHGDTVKRKLTPAQKKTLKKRNGKIRVTITLDGVKYSKTVRRQNVRDGCWEYYRRSDNDYAPSLRDYGRDYSQHGTGGKGYRHAGRGMDRT